MYNKFCVLNHMNRGALNTHGAEQIVLIITRIAGQTVEFTS